ncbi:MAG: winged helix-turn-helix domain-containing protein [Pseudohongiellaceae bacterium]
MESPGKCNQIDDLVCIGDWTVSFLSCTLQKTVDSGGEDTEVKVTPRSMDVLKYLCCRHGIVISLSEIISEIWSRPRQTCTDHLVHKAVAELRSALGDSSIAPRYIKTVPKRGYILIADVSRPVESSTGSSDPGDKTTVPERRTGPEEGDKNKHRKYYPDSRAGNGMNRDRALRCEEKGIGFRAAGTTLLGKYRVAVYVVIFLAIAVPVYISGGLDSVGAEKRHVRLLVSQVVNLDSSERVSELSENVYYAIYAGLGGLDGIDIFYDLTSLGVEYEGGGRQVKGDVKSNYTHLLRGTISARNECARIYLQLFDARSGMQLYAGKYSVEVERVVSLENQIGENIASIIRSNREGSRVESPASLSRYQ